MPPPPPNKRQAKLREVARHYDPARRRRSKSPIADVARQRLHDLGRFFHHRYGCLELPDDDSGRADLAVALDHLCWCPLVLRKWVRSWAPWALGDLDQLTSLAGRQWRATELGSHLGLTDDERTMLRITTIAPRGFSEIGWKETRKDRKRQKDRDRQRRKRTALRASQPMPKLSQQRAEAVRSVLSADWTNIKDLLALAALFPCFCNLSQSSRRRALNRTISRLADEQMIQTKVNRRRARWIREIQQTDTSN